ncbi:MAG: iron-sulfur cluster assembly scaffold protein [Gemmatimonadaceae bacterium]
MSNSNPYGPTLLQHFRAPDNRGTVRNATITQEGTNPLCGDRVRIEMLVKDDMVLDAKFSANACAICVAATDILTGLVQRAPLDEVETLSVSDVLRALDAEIPAARMNCVRLPLTVMHGGVQLYRLRAADDARRPAGGTP